MIVRTTADEKRDSAKKHLREASRDLLEFLSPDTYKSFDYSKEYLDDVEDLLVKLNKLRRKL
jgi:hypothetical protein